MSHSSLSSELPPSGGDTSDQLPTFNIVLFGEAGVGKSSVINLLAREEIAKTSPDAWGCTMKSERYTLKISNWRRFNIWDTVGMGEPEFSADCYVKAVHHTFELTQQLLKEGGIDLLLLCIPGKRITATVIGNYKLFYEVLCEKQVPIALVVTHLENEKADMDDWWRRNEDYIRKTCGLQFHGHACVATRPGDPKAKESLTAMEKLLLGYSVNGRYNMPSDWFQRAVRRFTLMPRSKDVVKRKKKLEQTLRDHCQLNPTNARLLAEDLTIFRSGAKR